jgi:hypothetical protein
MEISRKDLEAAFAAEPVEIRSTLDVFTRKGVEIHSFRYPVTNPEATARRFWERLAVCREHKEPPPWAEDDDEPDGTVVDAHICCDHAPASLASGELAVMDQIASLVRPYSERATRRILDWALDRLTDLGEPPF